MEQALKTRGQPVDSKRTARLPLDLSKIQKEPQPCAVAIDHLGRIDDHSLTKRSPPELMTSLQPYLVDGRGLEDASEGQDQFALITASNLQRSLGSGGRSEHNEENRSEFRS